MKVLNELYTVSTNGSSLFCTRAHHTAVIETGASCPASLNALYKKFASRLFNLTLSQGFGHSSYYYSLLFVKKYSV